MAVSTSGQVYVFLATVAAGVGTGLLFDLFRAWRMLLRPGNLSTGIGDLLFWLLVSVGVFLVIFTVNNGELRWFELLGIILGSLTYFLAFSHCCLKTITALSKFLIKIVLVILKIVLTPLAFLYKIVNKVAGRIGRIFGRIFRKIGRGCKKVGSRMDRSVKKLILVSRKS